ncbi:MAG: hypothetical protein AABY65_06340 [Nitrospirota bacterium]
MHEGHVEGMMQEVRVRVEGVELDFETASGLAKQVASSARRNGIDGMRDCDYKGSSSFWMLQG